MGKLIDLTGKVFGQLTVLERVKLPGENESNWRCRCTCGNEVVVIAGNLKRGTSQSCGCTAHQRQAMQRIIDLVGQKFGRLKVLYMNDRSTTRYVSWHCMCDCGNECDVDGQNLTSGHTKSCGCLQKEVASDVRFKDLTGQQFGYLTVIELVKCDRPYSVWRCLCKCGNNKDVSVGNLTSGCTTSCGCRRTSYGEENIMSILQKAEIEYLYNKAYFKDLFGSDGGLLRYDFILFDDNHTPLRLIEFDGTQHVAPQDFFGGEEKFLRQQRNDQIKNQYALSHNIPLVRIPYTKRDSMSIEDLLGDKYLIKGEI